MKKLENFFNSKKGKIVAWLTVLLVVLLAFLTIWFVKIKPKMNIKTVETPIEMNQSGEGTELIETSVEVNNEIPNEESEEINSSGEEMPEEGKFIYQKGSPKEFQINKEKNTISFDKGIEYSGFVLSDDPNEPTEKDTWHEMNESKEIELESDEIIKKYVYYAGSSSTASTTYPYQVGTAATYYDTLANAYAAITGTSGTIKVLYNKTDASTFTVASGKTITLNTNEKTITKTQNKNTNKNINSNLVFKKRGNHFSSYSINLNNNSQC